MTGPENPFTDVDAIRGPLYERPGRLESRSDALSRAKIAGANAADTIVELLGPVDHGSVVVDAGAGPGYLARYLARTYPTSTIVAVDQSHGLCQASQRRLAGHRHGAIQADYNRLPIADGCVDVVVAAFSLYHSPSPTAALAELARSLCPGGRLIAATKSADSYAQLDELVADTGLDPAARDRPSLYMAYHSTNAAEITAQVLDVLDVAHQEHQFRFDDFDHLAAYLATTPKYLLPASITEPQALDRELRARLPERPLTVTSTVTYVTARPRGGRPSYHPKRRGTPMTSYTKPYATPAEAARAMANWRWLTSLDHSGVTLPHATQHHCEVVMNRLPGHHPTSHTELETVARALGHLHQAANRRLGDHRIDTDFHDHQTGISITDFITPRARVLADTEIPVDEITRRPAAIYKDTNIRNVLVADDTVALVDFDDLTLAPVGYDLAKLIVSAAMTHGPLPQGVIDQLLDAYNDALEPAGIATDPAHLTTYTGLHGVLTAPYLGRNGYHHPWRDQ